MRDLSDPVVINIPNDKSRTNEPVTVQYTMRARNDWACQKFEVKKRFLVIVVNVSGKALCIT